MTEISPVRSAPRVHGVRAGEEPMPVAPTPASHTRFHPIASTQVEIVDGLFAKWQRDNRAVSIPHGIRWIEREGVLDNFRRVTGEVDAERRGWVFADSDLYKILEAISWDLVHGACTPWEGYIKDSVRILSRAQEDDGYLNTFVQAGLETRFGNLARGHELYCAGHLIQAAVAHRRVTGGDEIMTIARPFADYLVREFLDGRRDDTDGHPQIEMALVELFRETGSRRYLDLARHLLDVRGRGVLGPGLFGSTYFQDDVPVRERREIAGHAVRALYLVAGAVDIAVETGDTELLEAAEAQWASMLSGKTYLTGAVGSRFEGEAFGDPYELPPDLAYAETCASIAAFMASWRLLLATGRSQYADLMERVLYNVLPGSTALTRDRFFYVNPVQRRSPRRAVPAGEKPVRTDAPGTRAEWFDVACCPPNIMRTIASLGSYLATHDDEGVQLHLYVPCTLSVETGRGVVDLEVATRYPDDGTIALRLTRSPTEPWTLTLRVPPWASAVELVVAGEPVQPTIRDGYLSITRTWRASDEVVMRLPVEPRLTVPHPAVDAVRGTVAIERGPVVYCIERPVGAQEVDPSSLVLDPVEPLSERWDKDLLEGTLVIDVPVLTRDDSVWAGRPWADHLAVPEARYRPAQTRAIPYALWANRGPSQMRVWIPTAPVDPLVLDERGV